MSTDTTGGAAAEPAKGFEMIIEAGTLDTYLDSVGAIVEEAVFTVTDEGIRTVAVGPANVRMIDTTLEASACESFQSSGIDFGANIERIQKVVELANPSDVIQVTLHMETRRLQIEGDGFDSEVGLIDPESIRDADLPTLDLPCEFVLDAEEIDRVISGSELMSSQVVFETEDESLEAKASGDIDDIRFSLDAAEEGVLEEATFGADVESLFSLEQLECATGPLVGPVTMELGDEMPVTFRAELGYGPVLTMVAPRVRRE